MKRLLTWVFMAATAVPVHGDVPHNHPDPGAMPTPQINRWAPGLEPTDRPGEEGASEGRYGSRPGERRGSEAAPQEEGPKQRP